MADQNQKVKKNKIYALYAYILLLMSLSSCGANSPTLVRKNPDTSVTPATTALIDLLHTNKNNVAMDSGGLHVQDSGFHCEADSLDPTLVLTSEGPFDRGEIQQMTNYILKPSLDPSQPLPAAFQLVEGGVAAGSTGYGNVDGCADLFQITNIGNTTVQIPKVALRIKKVPLPNTFTYKLIDECSFHALFLCPPPLGGVPGPCDPYIVTLNLDKAALNDAIGGKPFVPNEPSCPELTLAPQTSIELQVIVSGPAFIYNITPEITLIKPQGREFRVLSSFTSILAFSSQFYCYGLQRNRFVPVQLNAQTYCR